MKKRCGRNSLCLIATVVSFLCGSAAYAQEASQVSAFLSPEGKVFFGDASNSLLIIDYPENVQSIEDYLKMIDQPPTQVLIEARVVEVKLSGEHSLGINWNAFRQTGMLPSFGGWGLAGETTSSAISQAIPYKSTLFPPATGAGTAETPFTMTIFNDDMSTIIKTLANSLDTNILSAPRVSVINNHEAEIKIVQELRWAIPSVQVGLGGALTITFAEPSDSPKDVGILLKVTPMITEDGEISMDLAPEISEHTSDLSLSAIVGTTTVPYTIPIVDTRNAKTKVVVGNKQTIIIGGLIKEKVTKQVSKIPLIGDIPYLGYLFKSKRDIHEKTELLIFVSPTIIDSSVEAEMLNRRDGYWYAQEEKKLEKERNNKGNFPQKQTPELLQNVDLRHSEEQSDEAMPAGRQESHREEIPASPAGGLRSAQNDGKMIVVTPQEAPPQETPKMTLQEIQEKALKEFQEKTTKEKELAVEEALQRFKKDK